MTQDVHDPSRRVLVVEDEPHIRDLVALHLRLDGWTVEAVGHGDEALRVIQAEPFDLIVLDLMLPGLDGLTILKALRREKLNGDVPVLLLTARREEVDKVLGLESGADDYLTKPFGVRELVARASALARRPRASTMAAKASDAIAGPATGSGGDDAAVAAASAVAGASAGAGGGAGGGAAAVAGVSAGAAGAEGVHAGPPLRLHDVTVDPARRRVTVGTRLVDLTSLEFDLLYLFVSNPGIVFSRRALLARVWKDDTFVTERSVDTLIKRIRRKIETDPADPKLILTVWGAGYKAADV